MIESKIIYLNEQWCLVLNGFDGRREGPMTKDAGQRRLALLQNRKRSRDVGHDCEVSRIREFICDGNRKDNEKFN